MEGLGAGAAVEASLIAGRARGTARSWRSIEVRSIVRFEEWRGCVAAVARVLSGQLSPLGKD